MVPRESALLRRPGREEGDALRSRGLWWWLMSLDRLGGGAGMKESTRSGDGDRGWPMRGGAAELPARNLQHKSNATGSNMNSWPGPARAQHFYISAGHLPLGYESVVGVLRTKAAVQLRPSLNHCEMMQQQRSFESNVAAAVARTNAGQVWSCNATGHAHISTHTHFIFSEAEEQHTYEDKSRRFTGLLCSVYSKHSHKMLKLDSKLSNFSTQQDWNFWGCYGNIHTSIRSC